MLARKCHLSKIKLTELNRKGSKQAREKFVNDFTAISLKVGDVISVKEWEKGLQKAQSKISDLSKKLLS